VSFSPQVTFDEGGGATPHTVALAAGQNIRIYSVAVSWDGSGAGGSFHPCLALYSQDGKLLSRTRPEQVLDAGDSGVVTYAPFLSLPAEVVPTGGALAFSVVNRNGPLGWADAWLAQAVGAPSTQLTANSDPDGFDPCYLSPDGLHVLAKWNSASATDEPWAMDSDGSNQTQLSSLAAGDMQWLDNATVAFQTSTSRIRSVAIDGSGLTTLLATANTIDSWQVSPDGATIAYLLIVAGSGELWVMDADGSNKTQLVTGLGAVANLGGPVWRLDGSRIVFPNGTAIDSVLPDGSGQQTELATYPTGFYTHHGMASDRLMFTDTTNFAAWQMASLVFGTGYALTSPALYLSASTHRGVASTAGGRVYTVQDGSLMGGSDDLVSILPDGSDLVTHFVPDESSAPLFQTVELI